MVKNKNDDRRQPEFFFVFDNHSNTESGRATGCTHRDYKMTDSEQTMIADELLSQLRRYGC